MVDPLHCVTPTIGYLKEIFKMCFPEKNICSKQNIYQTALWKQEIEEVNMPNLYAFSVAQIYLGQKPENFKV